MAIVVVCPNCKARFQVQEKYAGRKGKCPKCKTMITVPTPADMIEFHEPDSEESGGEGEVEGEKLSAFKPLPRIEATVQPVWAAGIVMAVVLVFAIAFALRSSDWKSSALVLALGAVVLAPPLVLGGYTFLRNEELEPYQGVEMAARAAICAGVYVVLWGVLWALKHWFLPGDTPLESWSTLFLLGPPLAIGTATAVLSLDLDAGNGFFHYCLYLGVCVLLRLAMGLSAL
jgi:predicted Zn finger-like uncharacterized protein